MACAGWADVGLLSINSERITEWCYRVSVDCTLDRLGGEASGALDRDFEDIRDSKSAEEDTTSSVVSTMSSTRSIVEPRYLAQQ